MLKKKTLRLHDSFYLNENRYDNVKNINKKIYNLIKKEYKIGDKITDIGCANGELLYFLEKKLKKPSLFGVDINSKLIIKAKKNLKSANFKSGSILNKKIVNKNFANYSICIGVFGIFDNFEILINNLIYWTKPKGKIIFQVLLNNDPYDVNIKYSHSDKWSKNGPKYYESGWNFFSKQTLQKVLKNNFYIKKFKFYEHKISYLQKKNSSDPLRSWTFLYNKKKKLTNGLGIIINEYLVKVDLK